MMFVLTLFLSICLLTAVAAVVYPGGSWCQTARCVKMEPVGKGWWLLTAELRNENQISWRKDVVVFREGDEFENRQAAFVRTKVADPTTETTTKEDLSPSDSVAVTIGQQELAQEVSRTKLELAEIKKSLNGEKFSDWLVLVIVWLGVVSLFC